MAKEVNNGKKHVVKKNLNHRAPPHDSDKNYRPVKDDIPVIMSTM